MNSIKSDLENRGKVFLFFFLAGNIYISNVDDICEIRADIPILSLFKTFASHRPFICSHNQIIKEGDRGHIL